MLDCIAIPVFDQEGNILLYDMYVNDAWRGSRRTMAQVRSHFEYLTSIPPVASETIAPTTPLERQAPSIHIIAARREPVLTGGPSDRDLPAVPQDR
jgi:hypothetical protein